MALDLWSAGRGVLVARSRSQMRARRREPEYRRLKKPPVGRRRTLMVGCSAP
jgi:hypothetical protein